MDFNVQTVTIKILTLFIVLFCGVFARKRRFLDENSTTALSKLLLNLTQPCLIISSFLIEFKIELIKNSLLILLCSVVIHLICALCAKFLFSGEKSEDRNAVYRYAFIFANCSFLGFPVLEIIFPGGEGIFYGSFYCIMFNLFNWTYGYSMMRRGEGKIDRKKIFLNVGTVSTLIGIILFVSQLSLPVFVTSALKTVGDMTFPLSMLIIGSLCATIDLKSAFKNVRGYIFCVLKNVALPLIAIGVTKIINLPDTVAYMAIVMCAMPSATSSAMFADTFGRDKKLAAQLVGMSTFFSVATIPLMLALAG